MFNKVLILTTLLFSQILMAGEVLNLNASHQVPVPSEKFAHLATFEITQFQAIIKDDGSATVSFNLPEDLSGGEKITITMSLTSDSAGSKSFSGEQADANCSGDWLTLECGVQFKNLVIKQGKLMTFLFAKYGYNQETKNRLIVSQIFAKDLFGLVKTNGKKE